MQPLVITAALVGAETTREQNPHLPIHPEEIAADAVKCWKEGCSLVHLHARNPDGSPSQAAALFKRIVALIRTECDVIVQVSTGGAVGMSVDERCGSLECSPDMATLSCGTVNFGDDVFMNSWPMIKDIAARIRKRGITPEIEAFDAGHIDTMLRLAKEGLVDLPAHVDLVLGVPGGLSAGERQLEFMVGSLPPGCTWTVAGVGRHQLPMAYYAVERGGNARVGLEDNIFLKKGVLAQGSAPLVAAVAEHARKVGRPLATPTQARELLRVRPRPE
ncbi:MAG: 3-keto-5-aminohexanoate cleavage protein [Deltaproteobacteria bacterium]|nr:3-keto-5-aminohexanoate cleavage protein [Deltaproteobacteria bacterium]